MIAGAAAAGTQPCPQPTMPAAPDPENKSFLVLSFKK
jgi:hypothetical protein